MSSYRVSSPAGGNALATLIITLGACAAAMTVALTIGHQITLAFAHASALIPG